MTAKPVFKQLHAGVDAWSLIGYAASWNEVAALLGLKHNDAGPDLSRDQTEGPDGFYLKIKGGKK